MTNETWKKIWEGLSGKAESIAFMGIVNGPTAYPALWTGAIDRINQPLVRSVGSVQEMVEQQLKEDLTHEE